MLGSSRWQRRISCLAAAMVLGLGPTALGARAGNEAAAPAAATGFAVGGHHLAYRPPDGWHPYHTPAGHLWQGPGMRLTVRVAERPSGAPGDPPVARARAVLATRIARSGDTARRQVQGEAVVHLRGVAGARVLTSSRHGSWDASLFVPAGEDVVEFCVRSQGSDHLAANAALDAVSATVEPDGAAAIVGLPSPVAPQVGPRGGTEGHRGHGRRRHHVERSSSRWSRMWLAIAMGAILLLLTAVPSAMGARAGWDLAAGMRIGPLWGASFGAYLANSVGIAAGTALALGAIALGVVGQPGGSGVMSLQMAGLLLGLVFALVATFAGAVGGMGAAIGAVVAGRRGGREAAARGAAVAAVIGSLLGPTLLVAALEFERPPGHHRSRR